MTNISTHHLHNISKRVSLFFEANGGMRNFYRTYAEGYINQLGGHIDKLDLNNDDLSMRELNLLKVKLSMLIAEYLKEHEIVEKIIITAEHDEYGCYSTYVSYSSPTIKVSY